jgi:hypothetical protein
MSDRRDYYETVESLVDHDAHWDPADVVERDGETVVPFRCHDCGRPAYYDLDAEACHHALEPSIGCFLIPAQRANDDRRHPDVVAVVDSIVGELCAAVEENSDATDAVIAHIAGDSADVAHLLDLLATDLRAAVAAAVAATVDRWTSPTAVAS